MYKCDICRRKLKKKRRIYGHTLCSKHMHQFIKYGRFLDNIPRTNQDLNDFVIHGNTAIFNVYGQDNRKQGIFTIDADDIKKVQYHKWRFSHNHIVTGQPAKHRQRDLSHIILNIPQDKDFIVVDHKNGDPTDNRKCNLRICSQGENILNKSQMVTNASEFIGVYYDAARKQWAPEIRRGYTRCHLGRFTDKKEAVYARYFAEGVVFGEYCNEEQHLKKFFFSRDLAEDKKKNIAKKVQEKLIAKKLWQSAM